MEIINLSSGGSLQLYAKGVFLMLWALLTMQLMVFQPEADFRIKEDPPPLLVSGNIINTENNLPINETILSCYKRH